VSETATVAFALARTGRVEEALEILASRARLGPALPADELLLYSRLLASEGRIWTALQHLEVAAAAHPQGAEIWMMLALAYLKVGRGHDSRRACARAVAASTER
jgi:Flp pilus assembly protein TadD